MGWFRRKTKDPVCGMGVDPASPPGGSAQHAGASYHFCSTECRARFRLDPARYTGVATAKVH